MLYFAVNYWAVIVVTVVAIILGMLWYGPLFGKTWTSLVGISMDKKVPMSQMKGAYIGQIITALLAAFVLAAVILSISIDSTYESLKLAFFLWLGFHGPVLLNGVFWAKKPVKLWQIEAGYHLVNLIISTLILVSWK